MMLQRRQQLMRHWRCSAFSVVDVVRKRLPPAWIFRGFLDAMALEMLLLADETPDAASDWLGR